MATPMPIRFKYFPNGTANPYQQMFARALAKHGVVMELGERGFDDPELASPPADLCGVHLHWLEWIVLNWSAWKRAMGYLKLRRQCKSLRRRGLKVIWTVHNHSRHSEARMVDHLGNCTVARNTDLIIAHSHWSAQTIRKQFRPTAPVVVMPHGNYDGCYHPKRSPEETRSAYGLDPNRPVCGLIGTVKRYRGHEMAIDAARLLGNDCQLLIAGHATFPPYAQEVCDRAKGLGNVTCRIGQLSPDEYAEAVQACDVILLPYQHITGSGAMLSAWTLSRPVVASDLPYFREFEPTDRIAARVADGNTPAALAEAVRANLATPRSTAFAAARAQADRYNWDALVEPVAKVIRSWRPESAANLPPAAPAATPPATPDATARATSPSVLV